MKRVSGHRRPIRSQLPHSDPEVRSEAARILAGLISRLRDSSTDVRTAATEALAGIGDPVAIPALVPLLYDSSPAVRQAATGGLAGLEGPKAVPVLVEELKNSNTILQQYAAEALGRIGDIRAVPALRLALQDANGWVRLRSAEALLRLRPQDAEAGFELMYLLQNSNGQIREAASKTLEPSEPGDATSQLRWTVLPPGWWADREIVERVTESGGGGEEGKLLVERLKFVESLGPYQRHNSAPDETRFGNREYFVFVFKRHVVAECPSYGNAIYVITDTHDWKDLLRHTKRELITVARDRVRRLVHRGAWKTRLRSIVTAQD